MDKENRERQIIRITAIGSVVNAILVMVKLLAGFLANSAAMIADGVHSLSDFLTDFVVILLTHISSKPHDENHKYGHGKFETLATAIIGLLLLAVGGGILYGALARIAGFLMGETLQTPGWLAFWAAVVSILSKEAVYQMTVVKGRKLNSEALMANAWHHRSDALSSIGTALGIGAACYMGESWAILDPLAAVIVSLFILKVSIKLLLSSANQLLECSLPLEVEDEIASIVHSLDGVSQMHHLRTRQIGVNYVISMHIRMDGSLTLCKAHDKATIVERKLRERFGEETIINIHVEPLK